MTRDIRVLNMADGQKIEPDLVMKRIGELEYRNMGTFAKMFLFDSGKALVVGSGLRVEPYSGMVVNVPSGICFQRSVDVILPCLEPIAQVVTVQAADGTPRTDIIEAQVKVVSDKSDTVQVMSVPSGSTSIVTLEEVKRDMRYYLSARAQKGTTTPTPATAAELTGTVAIATTVDLTEKYLLNLCNGEDGDYQEIDLRGANPTLTTRAEIIALINAAVGYTMASTGTGNVIVLTGEGTGQSSYFAIQPPVTDADKDAFEIVFGVSAGGAYRWPYVGDDEWFKLAEIDVGAATTDLTDTEIRNIDEKSSWSDGDDVLLMYHANEGKFDDITEKTPDHGVTIEGVVCKDGILTTNQIPNIKVQWTFAQLIGSGLSISSIAGGGLAALNETDVVFAAGTLDELRCYRFNSSTWSLVGSGLSIIGMSNPALAALNETDVAFIDAANDELRCYRFNGSTWSLVGSGLSISGIGKPALTALNETDVAFIDDSLEELRCYRFNGSTWSLVGSGLSISSSEYQSLAALNETDVAFIDKSICELRCYRFNGSTWSLVGSGLSLGASLGTTALTALNSTDVVLFDTLNDQLRCYRFNGSVWVSMGFGIILTGTGGTPALAALNGTTVAFIESDVEELRAYEFNYCISGLPYSRGDLL